MLLHHNPRRAMITIAVVAVALAGACSSSASKAGSSTRASTTTTTTTGPPSTSASKTASTAATTTTTAAAPTPASTTVSTTAPARGCGSGQSHPPAGAHTRTVGDVDGDGRRDTAWISAPTGTTTFGISTAAGGGASIPYLSASPIGRSALVVNADQRGPVEIILTDGRSANLYAFSNCAIKAVRNREGKDYAFDIGDRIGTGSGIGCVRTSAGRRLVGLNAKPNSNGSTVAWSRTIIRLNGLQARNGTTARGTYHAPADQAKIALLDAITCGDLTMQRDGVSDQSG